MIQVGPIAGHALTGQPTCTLTVMHDGMPHFGSVVWHDGPIVYGAAFRALSVPEHWEQAMKMLAQAHAAYSRGEL